VNHFQFFAPNFEKPVEASWFEFNEKSVPNYRVIDGNAPQNTGSASQAGAGPSPAPAPVAPAKK